MYKQKNFIVDSKRIQDFVCEYFQTQSTIQQKRFFLAQIQKQSKTDRSLQRLVERVRQLTRSSSVSAEDTDPRPSVWEENEILDFKPLTDPSPVLDPILLPQTADVDELSLTSPSSLLSPTSFFPPACNDEKAASIIATGLREGNRLFIEGGNLTVIFLKDSDSQETKRGQERQEVAVFDQIQEKIVSQLREMSLLTLVGLRKACSLSSQELAQYTVERIDTIALSKILAQNIDLVTIYEELKQKKAFVYNSVTNQFIPIAQRDLKNIPQRSTVSKQDQVFRILSYQVGILEKYSKIPPEQEKCVLKIKKFINNLKC